MTKLKQGSKIHAQQETERKFTPQC